MSHIVIIYSEKYTNTNSNAYIARLSIIKSLGLANNIVTNINLDKFIKFMPYNIDKSIDNTKILAELHYSLKNINPDLILLFNGISIAHLEDVSNCPVVSCVISQNELTPINEIYLKKSNKFKIMYFGDEEQIFNKYVDYKDFRSFLFINPCYLLEKNNNINLNDEAVMISNVSKLYQLSLEQRGNRNKFEKIDTGLVNTTHSLGKINEIIKNTYMTQLYSQFIKLCNNRQINYIPISEYLIRYSDEDGFHMAIDNFHALGEKINSAKIVILFSSQLKDDNLQWLLTNLMTSNAVIISNNHSLLSKVLGSTLNRIFSSYEGAVNLLERILKDDELRSALLEEQKEASTAYSYYNMLSMMHDKSGVNLVSLDHCETPKNFFRTNSLDISNTDIIHEAKKSKLKIMVVNPTTVILDLIIRLGFFIEKTLYYGLVFITKNKIIFRGLKKLSALIPFRMSTKIKNKFYNSRYKLSAYRKKRTKKNKIIYLLKKSYSFIRKKL